MSIDGIAPALRGGAMSIDGIAPALRGGAMSITHTPAPRARPVGSTPRLCRCRTSVRV
jgi:hypothetical protein